MVVKLLVTSQQKCKDSIDNGLRIVRYVCLRIPGQVLTTRCRGECLYVCGLVYLWVAAARFISNSHGERKTCPPF